MLVPPRFSSVADRTEVVVAEEKDDDRPVLASPAVALSGTKYLARLEAELEKLRQKDKLSPLLTKEVSACDDDDDNETVPKDGK